MGRYTDAICRLCRRHGEKLFLKGTRCNTEKCAMTRRAFAPGQHGPSRSKSKLSNYGLQMKEKQKVKRIYGVLERQFRRYFAIASKSKGVTGKILLQLLERRLDNVVFRMGLGVSRTQARQLVRHNFVIVDSKRVNIPSYLVSAQEVIQIKPTDKAKKKAAEIMELTKDRTVPSWLEFDAKELKARVTRLPEKDDIQMPIQEQLIVELYSK
jgi:small subunit ribosomal protein S4